MEFPPANLTVSCPGSSKVGSAPSLLSMHSVFVFLFVAWILFLWKVWMILFTRNQCPTGHIWRISGGQWCLRLWWLLEYLWSIIYSFYIYVNYINIIYPITKVIVNDIWHSGFEPTKLLLAIAYTHTHTFRKHGLESSILNQHSPAVGVNTGHAPLGIGIIGSKIRRPLETFSDSKSAAFRL